MKNINLSAVHIKFLAFILIPVICFILYFNSLKGDFIGDDAYLITHNQNVHNLSINSAKKLFTSCFFDVKTNDEEKVFAGKSYYRPMVMLSYMIEYAIAGDNPVIYHVTNIILHIVCGLLLFVFLQMLFQNSWFSFLSSLIFIIHPIQSPHIASISGRTDLLVVFFTLSGMVCYAFFNQTDKKRSLKSNFFEAGVFISFILALLSKESSFFFPAALLLYDFCASDKSFIKTFKKNIGVYVSIACIFGLFLFFRKDIIGNGLFDIYCKVTFNEFFLARFITAIWILADYFKTLLFPWPIYYSWHYVPLVKGVFGLELAGSNLMVLSLLVLLVWSFLKNKKVFFGLVFFLAAYFPAANIVPVWPSISKDNLFVGKQFVHVPLIGFSVLIVALVTELLNILKNVKWLGKKILIFGRWIAIIYLISFSFATVYYNIAWSNAYAYYMKVLMRQPASVEARNDLGLEYAKAGVDKMAGYLFYRAMDVQEKYGAGTRKIENPYLNCIVLHLKRGELDKAEEVCCRTLREFPSCSNAYSYLSTINFERAEFEQEFQNCRKALSNNPHLTRCLDRLPVLLLQYGEDKDLLKEKLAIIDKNPADVSALFMIGNIYRQNYLYKHAIQYYSKVIDLEPHCFAAKSNYAFCLDRLNEKSEAQKIRNSISEFAYEA